MSADPKQLPPLDVPSDIGLTLPTTPSGGGGGNLFTKLHLALRGRYAVVIPLSLLAALAAAYGGYKIVKPKYTAEGAFTVAYEVPTFTPGPNAGGAKIEQYDEWMLTQTKIIGSYKIIDKAFQSRAWQLTGRVVGSAQFDEFKKYLTVEHPPHTEYITVAYVDPDPKVAAAAASSIVNAYEDYYNETGKEKLHLQHILMQQALAKLVEAIRVDQQTIADINHDVAGAADFDTIYRLKENYVAALQQRWNDIKLLLRISEDQPGVEQQIDKMSENQIGLFDDLMKAKLERREKIQADYQDMLYRLGEKNPAVVQKKEALDRTNKEIASYAEMFRQTLKTQTTSPMDNDRPGSGLSYQLLQRSHKTLVMQEKALHDQVAEENALLVAMGQRRIEMMRAQEELKENQAELFDLNVHLKDLENASSSQTPSRLHVIGYGNEKDPSKTSDRRIPLAILFGLMGFGLPIFVAVCLAKFHRRYRYSDETDSKTGQPTLLGILPTLPDQLSDSDQAAVAAHCIHQIRIMLQVGSSLAAQEPKRVFMVTSANTGDGKTSLSMSLALSFAASGSRTLIIDCDMVGQGLTHRLRAAQSQGLHEALLHGSLQGRIKKTTTNNLYVLPIGGCDAVHAGSIAPTSIKKLLLEAKGIFDIVVIDTGPVLGSLEATVVATAADAVILTVSRGQNQAIFERAVRHLRSVGAFIAGMVFNRAEKRDFNRSVGAASVRSTSYQPVAPRMLVGEADEPSRFGPLARSVASFIPDRKEAPAKPRPAAKDNGNGNGNNQGNDNTRFVIDDEIKINIDIDPQPDPNAKRP